MIKKVLVAGDWIFDDAGHFLFAAALWFGAWVAITLGVANTLDLLKTLIGWVYGGVVGICIGILLPLVVHGLVEAIREALGEREREKEWERLSRLYE